MDYPVMPQIAFMKYFMLDFHPLTNRSRACEAYGAPHNLSSIIQTD